MERECFEDEEVAKLMNDAFVCIKVDREERPDIDSNYMSVCQMVTGHGGWPLTIVMTPDKAPFFAGTYIPKQSRFGRYGMLEFVPSIKEMWQHQRGELLKNAQQITHYLNSENDFIKGDQLELEVIDDAYRMLAKQFDEIDGGFGKAPKFPTPHNLMLLLRYWKRTGEERALFMVEVTLQAMRRGGIFDHVGFGFHRYSTDKVWLLPHFEKMLYDQAMLMMIYTEAYQATGKEEYRQTVEEIFTYLTRDMTAPDGGFYSAEDADSEGEEGKFYVWTQEEIRSILSSVESEMFVKVFNVLQEGNFQDEATHRKTGANILHLNTSMGLLAEKLKMPEKELKELLETARQKLFAKREKRIHPYKDDKVLSDWNGLMIAALAKAAQALASNKFSDVAANAVKFIYTKLIDGKRLYHRYRDGQTAVNGFLEDYVFLTWGLIELYEATFDVGYLQKAIDLTEVTLEHFWDQENGGFYLTADDAESVLVRSKEIYDGAIPSGNSVAMLNLLRLGRITARHEYEEKAAEINMLFSSQVSQVPQGHTFFLSALDFATGPSFEVVIAGSNSASETKDMVKALRKMFIPNKIVIFRPAKEDATDIIRIAEFTKDLVSKEGKATAYVCTNYNCKIPITDTKELLELFN